MTKKNSVILFLFVVVFKECFSKNFHRGLFCPLFFIILKVDCITVIMVINSFSLPFSPVKNKLFMQRLPLIGLFFPNSLLSHANFVNSFPDVCSWDWVRRWTVWKHYCSYFPIRLVKTAELDPKRNYLFGCHPHGILSSGAFGNFATEGNNVSQVFPGIKSHLLTLEGHYHFPLYREYLMCSGKKKRKEIKRKYNQAKSS